MTRLSHCSGLYPTCLVLDDVEGISKYPVASGGFGDIYTGLIGDQMACLKVVRIYGEEDTQKFAKAFLKEAILWKQLNHPNVLPFLGLYFLDATKHRICLISPWMENGNLRKYLSKHSVEFEDRICLAYDIACGLSYLHEGKIIHGDLKGDNVLISNTGRASIADFGLSRIANSHALKWTSFSASSHDRGGSIRWLAPECLFKGDLTTYASDIYAFGGVCYEVFTGLVPFHEFTHEPTILFQLLEGKRPSRSGISNIIWSILQDCWNQESSTRPVAKSLPGQLTSIASKVISPAENWNKSLPSQLWESLHNATGLDAEAMINTLHQSNESTSDEEHVWADEKSGQEMETGTQSAEGSGGMHISKDQWLDELVTFLSTHDIPVTNTTSHFSIFPTEIPVANPILDTSANHTADTSSSAAAVSSSSKLSTVSSQGNEPVNFTIPQAQKKNDSSTASSTGSNSHSLSGYFNSYMAVDEVELQWQAETKAALLAQTQLEENEFKTARQQLAKLLQ
ncbi:Rho guanine nucleotide exchange factor [Stygiomarasmius scandens]|uniref:Rho guanine nucleotide exchange factor n=1 Tax=Marasmiellus scandens TaxID=2682957 RepID=A0ABR1IQ67_9AGAR